MVSELPNEVKTCLWSYDVTLFDFTIPEHRTRLVKNVLDRGGLSAVKWLRENFSNDEIAQTIRDSARSEWNKKSLNLWSLVFEAAPTRVTRFA